MRLSYLTLSSVLCCVTMAGCGDPYEGRVEVVGTVKHKGKPIEDGTISFSPLDGQSTQAQVMISNGNYQIDRQSGLMPGKYLIRVSAGDGRTPYNSEDTGAPPGPGGANIISRETIPSNWNVNSKEERSVTQESPNRFDFDIP